MVNGLARKLHETLRDETIFNATTPWCGVGTLAMMASRENYIKTTTALYHVHAAAGCTAGAVAEDNKYIITAPEDEQRHRDKAGGVALTHR